MAKDIMGAGVKTIKLKPNKDGKKVADQLRQLGYEVRVSWLPKMLAWKDGKSYWVMVTPMFRGQQLTEEQEETVGHLRAPPNILVVKLPL